MPASKCEAPCSPACTRVAVSTVTNEARPTRVCTGHRKRYAQGQPLDVPLRAMAPQREGGTVTVGVSMTSAEREALAMRADALGISLGEAGNRAVSAWLSKPLSRK